MLKEKLDLLTEQLSDPTNYNEALRQIHNEVIGATSSMTSVPKPLKFMKPHYETLKAVYAKTTDVSFKVSLSFT
jgi:26S proteasome regulatory subunit N1